ncbi:MAG: hypothetical protein MJ156_01895 [Alphaproteobacteria bacterium]|nr:hypothetical protein [Alphaproteobacteria bacterium]
MIYVFWILCGLLTVALLVSFSISYKSQKIMRSLVQFVTNPDRTKIQDASNIFKTLLNGETEKISGLFADIDKNLVQQIKNAEILKEQLSVKNEELVNLADDATRKVTNMSQRLENTVDGLKSIVESDKWQQIQTSTDGFSNALEDKLTKIDSTVTTTTENYNKIQDQITNSLEIEKQISDQLTKTFENNTSNMQKITSDAEIMQQQLTDLSTSAPNKINTSKQPSEEYDSTMHNNDKLLNDYLTNLTDFSKRSEKEFTKQLNSLTETANIVGARVRLAETSIEKQVNKLEQAVESLNTSATDTESAVKNVTNDLSVLTNKFNGEIHDFSTGVVSELKTVSGVANSTLENTKTAANAFSDSVKNMAVGVRETLIKMNEAHQQLSGQSEGLIRMSNETTQQLQPLSELIEKYYTALPDLSKGSKEISDTLDSIVNSMVEKINIMKSTIAESLGSISESSDKLGDLSSQSRQQMIDLMSDYTKAVDVMQNLNKQMVIARASAPMEAIKTTPIESFKQISKEDFNRQSKTMLNKLHEQSVDLTRSMGADIPEVVTKKYNNGDETIFSKWLAKILTAADKKKIRELIKTDSVFRSQVVQFVHSFEKILTLAKQTTNSEVIIATLSKSDLGRIYNSLNTYI